MSDPHRDPLVGDVLVAVILICGAVVVAVVVTLNGRF